MSNKTPVSENETVELIKSLKCGERIRFSFGSELNLIDDAEKIETIRDEKELNAVREYKL